MGNIPPVHVTCDYSDDWYGEVKKAMRLFCNDFVNMADPLLKKDVAKAKDLYQKIAKGSMHDERGVHMYLTPKEAETLIFVLLARVVSLEAKLESKDKLTAL